MSDEMTKYSESLAKDCLYSKTNCFSRLPKYLVLSLTRFFYKEDVNVNAKILKPIEFPLVFDLFDHCSDGLKERLTPHRKSMRVAEDHALKHGTEYKLFKTDMEDDEGASNTAIYELKGIVTHQGRSSSEGHYIAWVKPPLADIGLGTEQIWFKMNDKTVTVTDANEILKLKGGADSDIAYMLFLGPKEIPLPLNFENNQEN